MTGAGGQGHRGVPHTADLRIEAWGPTRETCLAEAVRGLVCSFADVTGAEPHRTRVRHLAAAPAEDLLVAAVDEVIYWLDAEGEIPVSVVVRPAADDGADLVLSLAAAGEAEIIGAAPKAPSLHDLRCAPDSSGQWSCSVTIDV